MRKPYSYIYPGELSSKIFKPMSNNIKSTDLDRNFIDYKDCPDFTRRFRRDISLCIGIGFFGTIGLLVAVINADKIDAFVGEILKAIFI